MRQNGNTLRLAAAAVIAMGGAAWAGNVYLQPVPEEGPDPEQLRALAERLQSNPAQPSFELELHRDGTRRATVTLPPPERTSGRRKSPAPSADQRSAPATQPAAVEPPVPAAAGPEESDPVKNIALMGVTNGGAGERAWLVDLQTKDRDPFEEGQEAYGFTVGDIERNQVVLVRDGNEYVVRLGEKPIPSAYGDAQAPVTTASAAEANNRGGRGQMRRGPQQPQNRGNRRRSNNRRGNNRRWGGNNRGGVNPRDVMRNAANAARRGGGFGGNFNRNFNNSGTQQQVSSNPQTARRRGVRLVGDAEPIPQPPQVNNPQTQRRRGNTNGAAFGAPNNGNQQRRR
ncbi:MAG: hypothetical protein ACK47B_05280 [Armatimonadota bacterium]